MKKEGATDYDAGDIKGERFPARAGPRAFIYGCIAKDASLHFTLPALHHYFFNRSCTTANLSHTYP